MDKLKLFFAPAVILLFIPVTVQQQKPRPLPWEGWAVQKAYLHIINLTEYLITDATYKLRHAEKIQEQHKHSITYELGTIAAGILDHFKRMLKIYRKYSEEKSFIRRDYYPWEYLYAFHNIQGEYNEIRLEQGMFHDIVRDYEATIGATTKFTIPSGFTLPFRGARRFVIDPNNGSLLYIEDEIKSTTKLTKKRFKKLPWKMSPKILWKPSF